jgi:hypothetical protein
VLPVLLRVVVAALAFVASQHYHDTILFFCHLTCPVTCGP